jgi:hypothetical protein
MALEVCPRTLYRLSSNQIAGGRQMHTENAAEEAQKLERAETRASQLAWPSLLFAVLQSVCTALIAASGIRFAIGISSLISAIVTSTPVQDFHQDAIRLPMLGFALLGAAINLVVLWQVWRLR